MYSLNATIPGDVRALAADLHPRLFKLPSVRTRHSLLVKRFGSRTLAEFSQLQQQVPRALHGMPPCEARVDGIDYFETPTSGFAPVIYLTVDSPGLMDIHNQLAETFGAIPELEGDGYVPHITIARGGDMETARELADLEIEPITWTIDELHFWDDEHQERVRQIPLPV